VRPLPATTSTPLKRTMQPTTLTVIQDEHHALAAMLRSLQLMLAHSRREGFPPDFEVLRAMLFYVDEFPERLHHTKENELLFPKVRERCPELAPVLQRLEDDHARGEAAVRRLEHALLAYEVMGESRREAFEQATERYVQGYLQHMAVEETEILPAARARLLPSDWAEMDAAFATNRDPLTGHTADEEYVPLFRRILTLAPAPIGLG
jgi:hemerythrin-like domain-containing protein